jgi:hypothetical protein
MPIFAAALAAKNSKPWFARSNQLPYQWRTGCAIQHKNSNRKP